MENNSKELPKLTRSEIELGEKWDRCLADGLIKVASGVGLGIVFSVVLFSRRPWPVIFGSGIGIGMSYSNCQHDFRQPYQPKGDIIAITDKSLIDTIKKQIKG